MQITFAEDLFAVDHWEGNHCIRKDLPPGAASWSYDANQEPVTLLFICPCGCGMVNGVPVFKGTSGYGWKWNGSLDKPTLSPSILLVDGCRWHGWLNNGEWTSA